VGTVIDPDEAFRLCNCFRIGPTDDPRDLLCYSEGVLGALSDSQDLQCQARINKTMPRKMREQQEAFARMSKACAVGNTYVGPRGGLNEIRTIVDRAKCIMVESEKLRKD